MAQCYIHYTSVFSKNPSLILWVIKIAVNDNIRHLIYTTLPPVIHCRTIYIHSIILKREKDNPFNINWLFFICMYLYIYIISGCAFVFKRLVPIMYKGITSHRLHPRFSMQINITCFTSVWWFSFLYTGRLRIFIL